MHRPKLNGVAGAKSKLRCAIYPRKSSEEGLEQEFNSLDAQREACEAYIASHFAKIVEIFDARRSRSSR